MLKKLSLALENTLLRNLRVHQIYKTDPYYPLLRCQCKFYGIVRRGYIPYIPNFAIKLFTASSTRVSASYNPMSILIQYNRSAVVFYPMNPKMITNEQNTIFDLLSTHLWVRAARRRPRRRPGGGPADSERIRVTSQLLRLSLAG